MTDETCTVTSNQFAFLVRELGVMAHGIAQNADDGDEHSEVKLLRAATTLLNAQQDEIERLRAALKRASFYITAKMETTPQALALHEELREALSNAHETTPRCPVTWQPVIGGPVVPCTLPIGHDGKHLAPEPFAAETTPNLSCPTCGLLYSGRGGQSGKPIRLSCPNGHEWNDPRGGCNS